MKLDQPNASPANKAQVAAAYMNIAAARELEPTQRAGFMEDAKASFQKVVEVAPDSPQAQLAQSVLSSLQ